MKLRNKQTGEIIETVIVDHGAEWEIEIRNVYTNEDARIYNSLAELNADWEDAPEEAIQNVFMGGCGRVYIDYATAKEAEKAVEKLKAWKRLRDNGFKIKGWKFTPDMKQIEGNYVKIEAEVPQILINEKDLDLLFSGGEE